LLSPIAPIVQQRPADPEAALQNSEHSVGKTHLSKDSSDPCCHDNLEVVFLFQPMTSNFDRASEPTWFDRFFRDSDGNIVMIQPPNLPILVTFGALLLQFVFPSGKLQTGLELIAFGTLYTWAWLEIFQGVNYFRRSLGLLVWVGMMAFVISSAG
jgi:hypothetical protein